MSDETNKPAVGVGRRDALKAIAAAAVVPMLPATAEAAPAPASRETRPIGP